MRVAVVGAGPAGLAVAEELTVNGPECVVYDAWPKPGGLLLYGIPNFKLDKQIVYEYLNHLEEIGVKFICNTRVGAALSVDDLLEKHGYDAVFLGYGAPINTGMELIRMELGPPDNSGRRKPTPKKGSEFTIECDTVVLAIGYWPDTEIGEFTPGLETHKFGLVRVETEETGRTSRPGVFAGGDNVRGADLVVTAIAAARNAARSMDGYLRDKMRARIETHLHF